MRKILSRPRKSAADARSYLHGGETIRVQAEILLPTSDAMLAFINSGKLTHREMVGLNPEYLHELMWGAAPRAALARAILACCGISTSTTATG